MRIGILGGTFDPIHIVHLMVAEQVRTTLSLDKIWFMPAHIPPHKEGRRVTESSHRLTMVELAIAGVPYFEAISYELVRSGPSYTIDTIRDIKQKHPGVEFYFIIGGDMIDYLPHWHQIETLLELVRFVGVHRPGYSPSNWISQRKVEIVPFPQMDLSSTLIRELIGKGGSIRYMVPEQVKKYIEENRLYEPSRFVE